jgi:hypothetical protein
VFAIPYSSVTVAKHLLLLSLLINFFARLALLLAWGPLDKLNGIELN